MPGTKPAPQNCSYSTRSAYGARWSLFATILLVAGGIFGLILELLVPSIPWVRGFFSQAKLILLIWLPLWAFFYFGGLNVLRTAWYPSVASYRRVSSEEENGSVFEVKPARNSSVSPLIPVTMGSIASLPFFLNPVIP